MVNERWKAGTYFNTNLAAWRPGIDTGRQASAAEKTHDANIRLTCSGTEAQDLLLLRFTTACVSVLISFGQPMWASTRQRAPRSLRARPIFRNR